MNESWLREHGATDDWIHAVRSTGIVIAPGDGFRSGDDRERFLEARNAYIDAQPADVRRGLLDDALLMRKSLDIQIYLNELTFDWSELPADQQQAILQQWQQLKDGVMEYWRSRPPAPENQKSFWCRRFESLARQVVGQLDDKGIPMAFTDEEVEYLEQLQGEMDAEDQDGLASR